MEPSVHPIPINDCDLSKFLEVAAAFGTSRFGFVVTPNVDHVIRYRDDPAFRDIYQRADFTVMDSRFLAGLLKVVSGLRLPVCPGSDLTARLFESVIGPADEVLLIGGTAAQAASLRKTHHVERLRHYNPPMGFIDDPGELEACLQFIEQAGPFRYCFLAVGSPQQERVADLLKTRGRARGLALCVGGAINFLTGAERRAPRWVQGAGCEWLYRLLQDPLRLARRYLVRGPRIFLLLPQVKWQLVSIDALRHGAMSVQARLTGSPATANVHALPRRQWRPSGEPSVSRFNRPQAREPVVRQQRAGS